MSDVVGILLAAGSSRRFGADKRLQPMPDGTPMVLAAARKLAGACPRTLVVIRPDDETVERLLTEAGFEIVVCAEAEQGMGHSLACDVAATDDAPGWLIALADMPYIRLPSYRAVLDAMAGGAAIARPVHVGRPGHPVGFASRYYAELVALTGDRGGKAILDADPASVQSCPVDDPGVLKDIDQPA